MLHLHSLVVRKKQSTPPLPLTAVHQGPESLQGVGLLGVCRRQCMAPDYQQHITSKNKDTTRICSTTQTNKNIHVNKHQNKEMRKWKRLRELLKWLEINGAGCNDALVLRRMRKAGTEFPPPYFLPWNHGLERQLPKCSWYFQFHLGNAESWKEHCSYTCNKKNWNKKNQIDNLSWTHGRTEVIGQMPNLKSVVLARIGRQSQCWNSTGPIFPIFSM